MEIASQSDQFDVFDTELRTARDRHVFASEPLADEFLRGPSIHAGLNDTRRAVNTRGMDPDAHAYAEEAPYGPSGFGGEKRHYNPFSGYEPTERDEAAREAVGEDDDSGYNWGPEPPADPGAEPSGHIPQQPLHQLMDRYDSEARVWPPEEPPHFSAARHLAEADGPAPGLMTYQYEPGKKANPASELFGGEGAFINEAPPKKDEGTRWQTAQHKEALGQVPMGQGDPMWLGHGYAPGHRVGLPHGTTVFPGTVTHLDGYNVGVLYDDGQFATEEPKDIRPL